MDNLQPRYRSLRAEYLRAWWPAEDTPESSRATLKSQVPSVPRREGEQTPAPTTSK
jgi:hypothetical protein